MSSWQSHLVFAAVLSLLVFRFTRDLLQLNLPLASVTLTFVFLSSLLPDLDHRGSKIYQMIRSGTTLLIASVIAYQALPNLELTLISFAATSLGIWLLIGSIKFKHRGRMHRFSSAIIYSLLVGITSLLFFRSFLPAIFAFVAYTSHLILDGELKSDQK